MLSKKCVQKVKNRFTQYFLPVWWTTSRFYEMGWLASFCNRVSLSLSMDSRNNSPKRQQNSRSRISIALRNINKQRREREKKRNQQKKKPNLAKQGRKLQLISELSISKAYFSNTLKKCTIALTIYTSLFSLNTFLIKIQQLICSTYSTHINQCVSH